MWQASVHNSRTIKTSRFAFFVNQPIQKSRCSSAALLTPSAANRFICGKPQKAGRAVPCKTWAVVVVLLLITSVTASSTPLLLHASRPACDWGLTDVSCFFILCLVQQKSTHSYESCHLGVCINSSGNLSNECRDVRWSCRCGLNLEERLVNVLICVGWEHPEALSSFLCFHEILHYLWVWEGKFLCCTLYWNNFFFVSSLNETGLVLSVPSYRERFHFIRSTEDQIKVLSHGMSRAGSFQVCWLQLLPHL